MQNKNTYIGDEKFKKFLEHYSCPTPLNIVKLRFAGAICSPNTNLRPTDVISSFWEQEPRLETKGEAELFFKFFMGLWDEMFELVSANSLALQRFNPEEDAAILCSERYDELEQGFLEGFWGGQDSAELPAFIGEITDSISQLAEVYRSLIAKIKPEGDNKQVFETVAACDKLVNKSLGFLIEHYVLPHMDSLKRTVN